MNENITIPNPLPHKPTPILFEPASLFCAGSRGFHSQLIWSASVAFGRGKTDNAYIIATQKGESHRPKKGVASQKRRFAVFETYIALRSAHHVRRCGSRDVAWQLLVARGGPNHPGCREPRGPQVGTSGAAPAVEDGPIHTQPVAADGEWPQAARVRGGVQEPLPRLRRAASRPRLPRQAQRQHLGLGSRPAERLP